VAHAPGDVMLFPSTQRAVIQCSPVAFTARRGGGDISHNDHVTLRELTTYADYDCTGAIALILRLNKV